MRDLIDNIYEHISLPKPKEILFFPSIEETFAKFNEWSIKVEKVMTCLWFYQFPTGIPSSYWASYHLKKDSFRLDVKRSPNENGCFVYGEHLNKDPVTTLTKEQYEQICIELDRYEYDLTLDKTVEIVKKKYRTKIEVFEEYMFKEDETCQAGIEDFIFLGSYKWIQQECRFLEYCKNIYGVPINESMLQTLKEIETSKKLLLTFSNLVVVSELNEIQ